MIDVSNEKEVTIFLDNDNLTKLIDVCRKFGISYRMVNHMEDNKVD